jgi:AraC-like DNA-binding protein
MVLLAPIGAAFVVDCFGARLSARRLMLALKAGTVAALALGAVLVAAGALWRFVFAVAYGWLFVAYTAIAAFEARELRPLRAMPTGLRTFFVLFLIDIILIGAMFAFQLMDYFPGLNILWMILILSVFATTLIAFRSPDTYRLIESQAAKIRYERSRLMNVSVDRTIAEMKRLMADEELYRDSDLSLEDLAERLRMNAPQLSELLNLHVGLTFPVYVNGFRTEFAKRCLLSEPKDSILDIAFECGFNSKSTFNAAFLKATGLTPSEYRKRVLPPRP